MKLIKTIATHNGIFHADDVGAVTLLKWLFPGAKVLRTRDPHLLEQADVIVDVGGKMEITPEKEWFDHHQKEGAGYHSDGTPYAAFGLVWATYSWRVVEDFITGEGLGLPERAVTARMIEIVEKSLVIPIDALDNGRAMYGAVSELISLMNTTWMEDVKMQDIKFNAATELFTAILANYLRSAWAQVNADVVVKEAYDGGIREILVLPKYVPWQSYVIKHLPDVHFVVFQDIDQTWRVQTVPIEEGSFTSRVLLPPAWAGLRDRDLQIYTGVHDAIFCHNGRFITGAQSKEGALCLAVMAIPEELKPLEKHDRPHRRNPGDGQP